MYKYFYIFQVHNSYNKLSQAPSNLQEHAEPEEYSSISKLQVKCLN